VLSENSGFLTALRNTPAPSLYIIVGMVLVVHSLLHECVMNLPSDNQKPADQQQLLWNRLLDVLEWIPVTRVMTSAIRNCLASIRHNGPCVMTQHKTLCSLFYCVLITAQPGATVDAAESPDDFFENRIRPLLTQHCIECHGQQKQEGGLRLDSREGWQRGGDRGAAIEPEHPERSLLLRAVNYEDPELQMPPEKRLSPSEIANIEVWIQSGATDPRRESQRANAQRLDPQQARNFWSFKPLTSPEPPKIHSATWSQNPVDAFIKNHLDKKGLRVVPHADRQTLIRRATFDLTGMPPTAAEVKTFVEDESPLAFESLIDRLLNSPAYGERWGRHWLDIARYADTAGDGSDYPVREAAKYRNWVINAFNADTPYDQFVREQIAGDILAGEGEISQYANRITATGFLAIGKRYGYKASPAFQYLDFADVIDSLGRSLLGLSLGCARCHDHKYDPISADDYYAWYGILQSSKWAFPGGEEQKRPAHFPPLVPPSVVSQLDSQRSTALSQIDLQISQLKDDQLQFNPNYRGGGMDLGFEAQSLGKPLANPWVSAGPIEVSADAQSPFVHIHPVGKKGVRMGSGKPTDGIRYVFPKPLNTTTAKTIHFTVDFRPLESPQNPGAFRMYLGRGVVQSLAVEFSATSRELALRNGKQWEPICKLTPGSWYTLQVEVDPVSKTYSGTIGTADSNIKFDNKATDPNWDGVADCFICDGFGHVPGAACERDIDNLGLQSRAFAKPDSTSIADPATRASREKRLTKIETQLNILSERRKSLASRPVYPVAYAVAEADPINARIQLRGDPFRLGKEVPRRNLEILGAEAVTPGAGSGRLDLAEWITRPTNPLTARVFVNRVWSWHFGQGIVGTPSDFGSRGEAPTHPQLLDWLASDFIRSGWSIKHLHRLIMSSRTYQLGSHDHHENMKIDPSNRFHWRFSRRALDAESIRDAMLMVSGELNRATPTAHPFPPVDTWAFTIHNPFHGVYESTHRSIYMMIQRNRRDPYLSLFDAADPNQSVAERLPTTTPSQALFLMNSPFVHEQAAKFARKIHAFPGDTRTKLKWAFLTAHGRVPEEHLVDNGIEFLSAYQTRSPDPPNGVTAELRALSAFARVLLTSNAFLYLD
jgi:mono/diheme cytochrome c family protein